MHHPGARTEAKGGLRVWHVVVCAVAAGTALPVWLHHATWGVFNVHQVALAFFLWLNFLIALWEICLFLRRDLVEAQHRRFVVEYKGRELDRVLDFFRTPVPFSRVLSPAVWAELWSSYSVFDESYANKKSFGFWIDVGNGFSTLVPAVLVTYGMTFHLLPARALGVIGLLLFYQMWYGTVVYFGSYLLNERYVGHSARNLAIFVGLSNGIWLTFPIWGFAACIELIYTNSYGLFLR